MKYRILIVDDMEYIRQLLHNIFTNAGLDVCGEADDGEKGVNLYNTLKPDLITTDITMPKKNGLQVIAEIKKADPNAKIVVISSLRKKSLVMDVAKAGAKAFIVKPFDEKKVTEVIKKVLKTENMCFMFRGNNKWEKTKDDTTQNDE